MKGTYFHLVVAGILAAGLMVIGAVLGLAMH